MKIFSKLQLWIDPVKRSGPEAMAVDEWLLETAEAPVLRVYGWAGDWASIGYFGKVEDARFAFRGPALDRRRHGGSPGRLDLHGGRAAGGTAGGLAGGGELSADPRGARPDSDGGRNLSPNERGG